MNSRRPTRMHQDVLRAGDETSESEKEITPPASPKRRGRPKKVRTPLRDVEDSQHVPSAQPVRAQEDEVSPLDEIKQMLRAINERCSKLEQREDVRKSGKVRRRAMAARSASSEPSSGEQESSTSSSGSDDSEFGVPTRKGASLPRRREQRRSTRAKVELAERPRSTGKHNDRAGSFRTRDRNDRHDRDGTFRTRTNNRGDRHGKKRARTLAKRPQLCQGPLYSANWQTATEEEAVKALLGAAKKGMNDTRSEYMFPHQLVRRGDGAKPIRRGEASMEEYGLALALLERHPGFPDEDIAALGDHRLQVARDVISMPWEVVRRYSEETFEKIGTGAVEGGWGNTAAIDNIRVAVIATASLARRSDQNGYQTNGRGPYARDTDGTLCGPWNRGEAFCTLAKPGTTHMAGNVKLIHICGYCANKFGKMAPHTEATCGAKRRFNERETNQPRRDFH